MKITSCNFWVFKSEGTEISLNLNTKKIIKIVLHTANIRFISGYEFCLLYSCLQWKKNVMPICSKFSHWQLVEKLFLLPKFSTAVYMKRKIFSHIIKMREIFFHVYETAIFKETIFNIHSKWWRRHILYTQFQCTHKYTKLLKFTIAP